MTKEVFQRETGVEDRFRISSLGHVRKRIMERYRKTEAEADGIIGRVMGLLEANTPVDWRFTESPSSRFFIVDEEIQAKLMGLSYRDSQKGRYILNFVRENIGDTQRITNSLPDLVEEYKADVTDPALPIIHDIRTVYGRGEKEGTIGEEKNLFQQARLALSHTIPIQSRRIAARPNAVTGRDGKLWARQYLNWMSMDPNGKEYYLFLGLKKEGLDRCRFTIFSYTPNGDLKMVDAVRDLHCAGYHEAVGELRRQLPAEPPGQAVRSESYWKVPTCVDRRYIDLDFKERYTRQGPKPGEAPEPESFLTSDEALELCFLREIVERAQAKLHK